MAGQYETYLARLRQIKQSRPEMAAYNRTMQTQSKPFNLMNEATARMTQQGGASTGAQIAALSEGRRQWNQEQQGAYNQALTAGVERDQNLDLKIAEVEAANEAQKQQEAIAKGQGTANAIKTGLTIAGTAVGAILGAPQAGAAIGEAAGGFVGVDKDGNLSLSPEDWDTQRIVQGAGNTIGAFANMANEEKMNKSMKLISSNVAAIQEYLANNPDMAPTFRMQMEMLVKRGDYEGLSDLFNNVIASNVQRRDMATGGTVATPPETPAQGTVSVNQEVPANTQVVTDAQGTVETKGEADLLDLRQTFRNAGYSSAFVNDDEKLLAEAIKLGYIVMNNGVAEWTKAGKASKYYKGN